MFKTTQNRLLPALIITAFAVAAILAQASAVSAQDTLTGAFQGTVFNNVSGVYLGGATVDITSETTGVIYRLTSDSNGRFYQGLLSPGWYQINVSITGYKGRLLRREIKVSVTGEIVPVPVPLEPEAPGVVTPPPTAAEPAADIRTQINTSDARRDASYKTEELAALPLGGVTITRSFDELGLLAPGAAPPPQTIGDVAGPGVGPGVGSAGQFSVNGIRSRANNFTVDGSDNNDEDIGVRRQGFVALVPQPIESIQEFQIITLLAPAQFGRNIGGQVNAVSKGGGREVHGSLYGFFNSDKLNARNFFDSEGGQASAPLTTASGQAVLLDGQPLIVTNDAGSKDPLTAMQGGGTLGGPIVANKVFYFISGEYAKINAAREMHFAVPTVEERGPFGTGATGIFVDPFLSATNPNSRISAVPNDFLGSGLIIVFPFANDPTGVYGANTFTQVLPAGGRGLTLSGRADYNFAPGDRPQLFTVRYNFTDDKKDIPAVNEALFSSVLSKIRTHNLSTFLNSRLNSLNSETQLLNQFRFSIGRTHLNFAEIRDRQFMVPSLLFPNEPFLLNAPFRFNLTTPAASGVANTGPVNYASTVPLAGTPVSTTAEDFFGGPVGQITVAGFSPVGTDVYNFPQDRKNTTLQLADGLTWQTGRHAVSVGADIRRTDLDSDLPRLSRTSLNFNGVPRLIDNGSSGFRFPTSADPNPIVRPADLLSFGAATNALLTLNVDRPDSKVRLRFYQFDFYGQDTWRVSPNFSVSFGLRYEYNSPVNEVDHLIENTFTDDRLSLVPGLSTFIDGRTHLYEPDRNNFAPRVGIAYSGNPFGPGRPSVFRAGYGLFYDQVLGAVANQSRNVFPTFLTFNFAAMSGTSLTALQYQNPSNTIYGTNQGINVPVVTPGTINQFNPAMPFAEYLNFVSVNFPDAIGATLPDRNLEMPMAHHYSAVFE
ncbi:MAG: TonB-dependent receptor, partial [Acidobacteriota bacterium]